MENNLCPTKFENLPVISNEEVTSWEKKKGILNTVMNTFLIKKMVNNGFDSKIFLSPATKSEKSSAPKQPRDCNKYVSPVSWGTR